jgi:hypothetical protein
LRAQQKNQSWISENSIVSENRLSVCRSDEVRELPGANCSATDTIDIIHNYVEFETPQEVGVFSDDKTGSTLQALGEKMIKIISDQGSIMNWTVLYTPNSSGTVLSPDNYHTTHNSELFAFYHLGTNDGGKIGFLDHNK